MVSKQWPLLMLPCLRQTLQVSTFDRLHVSELFLRRKLYSNSRLRSHRQYVFSTQLLIIFMCRQGTVLNKTTNTTTREKI